MFQRATLAVKCAGLTDDQLRERAVPPSSLSLLGLVRHMAEVERNWFRPVLDGDEMSGLWPAGPELRQDLAFDDVVGEQDRDGSRDVRPGGPPAAG